MDAVRSQVNACEESLRPIALLNPYLVDMGTTGFGMAGRMFKERLVDALQPCYYLRTLDWGALARTYPKPYTVWREDGDAADGYVFIRNFASEPNDETLEELYDEVAGGGGGDDGGDGGPNLLDQFAKFVDAFQKL